MQVPRRRPQNDLLADRDVSIGLDDRHDVAPCTLCVDELVVAKECASDYNKLAAHGLKWTDPTVTTRANDWYGRRSLHRGPNRDPLLQLLLLPCTRG